MVLALVLAVFTTATQASGFESADAAAHSAFLSAAAMPAPRFQRAQLALANPLPALLQKASAFNSTTLGAVTQVSAGARPSQSIGLDPLLNRHLKTNLQYNLGGVTVWVSGGFDRSQNAYVAVTEQGKPARFFNVEELAKKAEMLDLGSAKYRLSLSPDLTDLMESEIVLTNQANRKDQQRPTLREMLGAVAAAGESAQIGGAAYKVFYYDDIGGAATRSFAFILTDAKGQFHVFLVPAELVPADRVAVFKMHENRSVGLQRQGGQLQLFDNP